MQMAKKGDYIIKKIVSGGQTGVDRAALDVAMGLNIPVGGWCPKGRKAEDGAIEDKYPLQETNSHNYETRTRLNVRASQGTLILTKGVPAGGTALTIKKAQALDKEYIVIDLDKKHDLEYLKSWLFDNRIEVLNVAGPRASKFPEIYDQSRIFLEGLLGMMIPESTIRT